MRALLWGRVWEVYIKVPPKAGGRWGNLTEIRLNRFQIRLNRIPPVGFRFTDGLSRRLDRTQIRFNRFQIRFNRFQIRLNRIQNSVAPVFQKTILAKIDLKRLYYILSLRINKGKMEVLDQGF